MTAAKIRNATATQNSALMVMASSPLERGVNGCLHRLGGRRLADQPLDDGAGRVQGDAAHVAEGGLLGGCDGPFRLGEFAVELFLEVLAGVLRFGIELAAGLAGKTLGAAARVGQRLLVGAKLRVSILA